VGEIGKSIRPSGVETAQICLNLSACFCCKKNLQNYVIICNSQELS